MNGNVAPAMRASVVAAINPQSAAANTYTSGWVDMQAFFAALALIQVGALGASATVDAKLEQATASDGTGAKDVTGSAITQLTKAGTDDNKQVEINLFQSDLDRNNGYRFVRLSVTTAVAASLISGVILGMSPRYGTATANDAATVDEVVS